MKRLAHFLVVAALVVGLSTMVGPKGVQAQSIKLKLANFMFPCTSYSEAPCRSS